MQSRLTHGDRVPVSETAPGQEAYRGRINGFKLPSTLKRNQCLHQLMLHHEYHCNIN